MADHTAVREALRELGRTLRNTLPPPGDLAVIRARARRRRIARVAAAASALGVVAGVAAVAVLGPAPRTAPPSAPHALATGSPSPSADGAADDAPTLTAAPSPSAAPVSTTPGGRSSPSRPTNPDDVDPHHCAWALQVTPVAHPDTDEVTVAYPVRDPCGQTTARFFWASYTFRADGSAILYASHDYHVDPGGSVRFHMTLPAVCPRAWFFVVGEQPVRSVIPKSQLGGLPYGTPAYPGPDGGRAAQIWFELPDPFPCPEAGPPPTTDSPAPTDTPTP